MGLRVAVALGLGTLLLASAAAAVSAQSAPGEPSHLGVQFRALAGPGYVYAWQDLGESGTDTIEGVALAGNVALGAMVADDLALDMDLVLVRSPDVSYGVLDSTEFTAVHLGVGLTWWLMPANVYLAGSLGAARTSVQNAPARVADLEIPTDDTSDLGIGAHLAVGKLWWVDVRWGLGVSFSLALSTAGNDVAGAGSNRHLVAPMLALSATFH